MTSQTPAITHYITPAELPLCCPRPNQSLWNAHPRVYLPIETTGHATCPYCSAEYILSDADTVQP